MSSSARINRQKVENLNNPNYDNNNIHKIGYRKSHSIIIHLCLSIKNINIFS